MKNIAVILAGGVGSRVGAGRPKQFIEVLGRPVLAYTIERFEKHPEIDAIEVVCIASHVTQLQDMVKREGFSKVQWVTTGGATFQESVINGLANLKGKIADEDQVLIHYGASPMVSDEIISDAIRVCREKGNASPAHSLVYLAAHKTDAAYSTEWVDRDEVMCLNSPQALRFGYVCALYDEGRRRGLLDKVEPHTTSLMLAMGEPVYFSKNSTTNIKITTKDDLALFEAVTLHDRWKNQKEIA